MSRPLIAFALTLALALTTRAAEPPLLLESKQPTLEELLHTIDTQTGPARHEALRRLTQLYPRKAAAELARRIDGSTYEYDCATTLEELPDRDTKLAALRDRLTAPDQPVSVWFQRTLEAVSWRAGEAPERPKVFNGMIGGQPPTAARLHRNDVIDASLLTLIESLPAKTGNARSVSTGTVLQRPGVLGPAQRQALIRVMPEVFESLSPNWQSYFLERRWYLMRSPQMAPVLLRVAASLRPDARRNNDAAELFNACLTRAHDADPALARPILIDVMRHPGNRFSSRRSEATLADRA
jgi:hypothetical protein